MTQSPQLFSDSSILTSDGALNGIRSVDRHCLNLVFNLCKLLNEEEIDYCHWKSNAALDRSACGDNDLDLLVGRTDVLRFKEILYRLGFKEAQVPVEKQLPGIQSYYGFDRESNKLVHVHAHYQLILGHDMSKNYHLPIEEPYLRSAMQGPLFKVPAVEFELIVFVIRMVLKHLTWDAVLGRQGALSASERQELQFLQSEVDHSKMHLILSEHLPFIEVELFDRCLSSLHLGASLGDRLQAGRLLQRRLKAQSRRPQFLDICLKPWRRVTLSLRRRILKQLPQKRLVKGGALIALVGGDGSGKSTAVNDLHSWLAKNFDATKVHMGRPKWSFSTCVVRGALKMGKWLGIDLLRDRPVRSADQGNLGQEFPGYAWMFRQVLTARDRYLTYVKARRYATNGGIVICDRFPQPQIKLMDGPQIEQSIKNGSMNRLIAYLIRVENHYYQQMMPPDILLALKVDPAVAVLRKTNEDSALVRMRCQEVWDVDWRQTRASVFDAGLSPQKMLSELRTTLWSEL